LEAVRPIADLRNGVEVKPLPLVFVEVSRLSSVATFLNSEGSCFTVSGCAMRQERDGRLFDRYCPGRPIVDCSIEKAALMVAACRSLVFGNSIQQYRARSDRARVLDNDVTKRFC
jgi:hypothetical protein